MVQCVTQNCLSTVLYCTRQGETIVIQRGFEEIMKLPFFQAKVYASRS